MKALNRIYPDVEVLALDIEHWGSPVAQANVMDFIPYLKIYDGNGILVAEGKQAGPWLLEEGERRRPGE